jgi:lambda family phage portal protein
VRVPAAEVLHIFTPQQAGQVRGLPRMTTGLVGLYKMDEYEDSALERAAVAAKFAGFIKNNGGEAEDPSGGAGTDNKDGSRSFPLESGVIYELDANEEWQESKPPDPGANYDDFTRRQLAKIFVGLGVPYAEASGDLKSANFSSIRVGRQPFQRATRRWGNGVLVHQALRPAIRRWMQLGLLGGTIKLSRGASRDPGAYDKVQWTPPTWEYVDPLKDAQADGLLVDHGFKTRDAVIVERGGTPQETDEQAAAAKKRADKLGLTFATSIPTGAASQTSPDPADEGLDEDGNPKEDIKP